MAPRSEQALAPISAANSLDIYFDQGYQSFDQAYVKWEPC